MFKDGLDVLKLNPQAFRKLGIEDVNEDVQKVCICLVECANTTDSVNRSSGRSSDTEVRAKILSKTGWPYGSVHGMFGTLHADVLPRQVLKDCTTHPQHLIQQIMVFAPCKILKGIQLQDTAGNATAKWCSDIRLCRSRRH